MHVSSTKKIKVNMFLTNIWCIIYSAVMAEMEQFEFSIERTADCNDERKIHEIDRIYKQFKSIILKQDIPLYGWFWKLYFN